MPNRIIREAILSSEKMALLKWPEEVFYRRLLSIIDDYGRYEANPQLLRSRCYPLQTDEVRVADITRWVAACQTAGLILGYAVLGKQYLEVINFGQQQRTASKYPAPPSSDIPCDQLLADAHLVVSVSGVVSEVEGVSGADAPAPTPIRKKSTKTAIPVDFTASGAVQAWANEKGYDRLAEHLDAFRRKVAAAGYTYIDWDAAFMEAIREDWAKLRGRAFNGVAPPANVQPIRGRDPALQKLDDDARRTTGPSLATLEKMAQLRGKVTA